MISTALGLAMAVFALWLANEWSDAPDATTARAGGLLRDEGARLFTLLHRIDAAFPAVGVMPNGDVILTEESRQLWRLGLNGRYELLGALPEAVDDIVGETPTTILTHPSSTSRIERYDLTTGRSAIVADLTNQPGRYPEQLIVLDDGSIVVTDNTHVWRVGSNGVSRVLRGKEDTSISSLAALPDGAFAYVDNQHAPEGRTALVRVGRDGQRRILLRLHRFGSVVLASAGGQLVVIQGYGSALETRDRTQILRIEAGRIREKVIQRVDPPVYGNGDGYSAVGLAMEDAHRALLASDGSLLVFEKETRPHTLRALVPNASPRLRLAFIPATWRAFARGRVDYIASAAGKLDVLIRDARGRTVLEQGDSTPAGAGTLRLRRALPRGVYDVRLALTTSSGTRAQAKARILTITTLSLDAARSALHRDFYSSEGDLVDAAGTKIGKRCVRRNRRRIDCRVIAWEVQYFEETQYTCRGWAVATLRLDGIRTTEDGLDCEAPLSR